MRKKILLFFLTLTYTVCQAQQNLSGSIQSSAQNYIYRITPAEAKLLFKSGMQHFSEQYLYTIVDSFFIETGEKPKLKTGNYLFVHATGNRLVGELTTIDDLQYKIIYNNRDLMIALHTQSGQPITNATVFINNKKIPFHQSLQAFMLSKHKRKGTVSIYHDNVLHQFKLTRNNNYSNSIWRGLAYSFPIKYIAQPVKRWLANRNSDRYVDYFRDKAAYEKKFSGFFVFSKPIYKPGDTVKLKAFILNKRKQPVNLPLLLRLSDRDLTMDSIIAVIKPYRPGGYNYEFVVNDSLDLSLDDDYLLTLEELKSRKYNLDEYDGDLDDEQYALRRKILIRGEFKYEEYELSSVIFNARSDKEEHNRGNPASIYLKAIDENELTVMDGRVQVVVKPTQNVSANFHQSNVFLPDTLWHHTQLLDAVGETKIPLPDSIFPPASFGYEIECIFLNSNNERQSQRLRQHYDHDPYKIIIEQKNDSLFIQQLKGYQPDSTNAVLYTCTKEDDTLNQQILRLPATIKINPFASYYEVETDSSYEEYELQQKRGMVSCVAIRTRDSVSIQVINPNRLFFWYTLFAGNRVIERGYADKLFFSEKSRTRKNYFVSLQYVYGNNSYTENYTAAYQDKLLTIQAEQSSFVYPGQTTNVNVLVKNADGNPVKDADITAYAFTKKFQNVNPPFVPYMGKTYPLRKRYSSLYVNKEEEEAEGSVLLNWQRWSKEMGLDSIEYFRFLHTSTIYQNLEPAKDSITQIAPFVVINGELQPVHQIYIDERPVFFSQSQQLQRYSFYVSPGKHTLRLRTNRYMVKVDSIWASAGGKTFFSINADTSLNKMIRLEKMPDSLTNYEKNLWSKYMLLVENNFGENFSYIAQNNLVSLLNKPADRYTTINSNVFAGPFPDQPAILVVKNKFEQQFDPEGNYLFNITKGLIKQKQLPGTRYPFSSYLTDATKAFSFKDFVLTETEVDSLWQDYLDRRSANEDLFRNELLNKQNNGRLSIGILSYDKKEIPFIKNIFLFKYDDLDFMRIYKGTSRDLGYLQPGAYRLLLLLKGDKYFVKDSLFIKADGINYYSLGKIVPISKDSLSTRIAAVVNSRELLTRNNYQEPYLDNIRETFNEKFLDSSSLSRTIFGQVKLAKDNMSVAGVTISIKGTRIATTSDAQGYFYLKVPRHATIVISGVGYEAVEKRLSDENSYEIRLREMSKNLNEVVVVGYGVQRKKELTAALSLSRVSAMALQGKVAGVNITLRGISSIDGGNQPIIMIDGLPYSGDISKLDYTKIANITILKGTEAVAIYGAKGENGVILVTTKKNNITSPAVSEENMPLPGNTLRKNFKDDAFWQPRLRTDAEGKVSFKITYPDDITNWRSFFIAVAGKQTGFLEQHVKSFKLLSGTLTTAQFLIEGDSTNIIGKALNYSMDSISVRRMFSVNKQSVSEKEFVLQNSRVDTFPVKAGAYDSLTLSYSIQKLDGYFDGEERTIPVFKQGVLETNGLFLALEKDTSFTYQPKDSLASTKLYAEASLLPVLLNEMESIRRYEYLCNEQLASKLKSLILKRKVYKYLKKEFKEEKNIAELITKLNQGRSQAGLWGWWNNNDLSMWISLHAIEALLQAEEDGYTVSINKPMLTDYLVMNMESYRGVEKISSLRLLKLLQAKVDFSKYIDSLEKYTDRLSQYEKLRLLQLKQELAMPVSLATLVNKYQTTLFGNRYWGEESREFFNNTIQNTLLMYRLMRKNGGYKDQLSKVRNYFLEKRKDGNWRNTYESSLILETILPDILQNDSMPKPASIQINSSAIINSFPYSAEIKAGDKIQVSKKGDLPVYFTAYQKNWNLNPKKVSTDFIVNSFFERNGEKQTILKTGEPVILKVNVSARADADYVMIEIPIPAGCSYKDKSQSYLNNEVHREYFKNKVSIFCKRLQKGEYTFIVSLLPRYTGLYHLNPAKAEMMYFPVFFGREELKKVEIR